MPNIRRHGVVETRAPDSPDSIDDLMKIATTYAKFGYDAPARAALLQDFSGIDPQLLQDAFLSRFKDPQILSRDIGGGKSVADLVAAISEKPQVTPAIIPPRRPSQGIGL